MAHYTAHSRSSAARWGGEPHEYDHLHRWMDETKGWFAGPAHRALRHHTMGVWEAERVFGSQLQLSTGKLVPVTYVLEQHIIEDLGFLATPQDWLKHLTVPPDMKSRGPAEPMSVDMGSLPPKNI